MRAPLTADVIVVGGGCIGLTVATAVAQRFGRSVKVTLLEKEKACGKHSSGRNSGVLHAGIYYKEDSVKAKLVQEGNQRLTAFIEERGLLLNRCGKLLVAQNEDDVDTLKELYNRGRANNANIELITAKEAASIEPRAFTHEVALWSPTTCTSDPVLVNKAQVEEAALSGVDIRNCTSVQSVRSSASGVHLKTSSGEFEATHLINAAGLYADRLAHMCGVGLDYSIVPFKGLYLKCDPSFRLATNIYPTPQLSMPFLGTHLTVTGSEGQVKIGPTAMPAFWRQNYTGMSQFNFTDMREILPRFAAMLWHNRHGVRGLASSEFKKYTRTGLCRSALCLLRDVHLEELLQGSAWSAPGIRAQLIRTDSAEMVDDFVVLQDRHRRSTHVLNAVSPAWTCNLPFADLVCDMVSLDTSSTSSSHTAP